MPEEQTPQPPKPEAPKAHVTPTPLSIVEFGAYSILIYNRAVYIPQEDGSEEVTNEIMLQLRRTPRSQYDDPSAIPLTQVPGLVMMLEEVAKSSMAATPIKTKPPEAPPAPATKKQTAKQLKKR